MNEPVAPGSNSSHTRRLRRTGLYRRWLQFRTAWQARRYGGDFDDLGLFCLFVGHGRSGHSLVAALIDAHPRAIMADELDSLALIDRGFGRRHLFAHIAASATRHAKRGRRKGRAGNRPYSYRVPGQWQGRWQQARIIGEATNATARLYDDPRLYDRLQRCVRLPVRFVQVVRNPYDSISRLHLLTGHSLVDAANHYFDVCRRTAVIGQRLASSDIHRVHLETLIAEPEATLTALCAFFGLEATADYLSACGSLLFREPNRSRHEVPWPEELVARVADEIAAYSFLRAYDFET